MTLLTVKATQAGKGDLLTHGKVTLLTLTAPHRGKGDVTKTGKSDVTNTHSEK